MKKLMLILGVFSLSFAQDSLEDLKRQLEEQGRIIQELESKIQSLEKAQKEKTQKDTKRPEPADRSIKLRAKFDDRLRAIQINPFRQTALLPDISLIVDTSFVSRNIEDKEYEQLEIPSLYHGAGHYGHSHALHGNRGFNLNYAELYFYAPVDPYFDLYSVIGFSKDGAGIEEAYAISRGLPLGFQLKLGRFRSFFGRLNVQHPHAWDFATPPLVNKVFLGDEGLIENGVQINWLAPTPFYLLFGIELLQGENEQSFGTKGFEIGPAQVEETSKPNLYVGFVKTSFDVGNLTFLTGLSYAQGGARHKHNQDEGFVGKTKLYGFDLTARYSIDSIRYVALQGEYIYRDRKGTKYEYDSNTQTLITYDINQKQSGFYTQLVYRFDRRWKAGVQYNLINKNEVNNLPAYYAMVEYTPTEFSRIRLQAGHNRAFYEGNNRKNINEIILQFTFAIGAHGAHPF